MQELTFSLLQLMNTESIRENSERPPELMTAPVALSVPSASPLAMPLACEAKSPGSAEFSNLRIRTIKHYNFHTEDHGIIQRPQRSMSTEQKLLSAGSPHGIHSAAVVRHA